MEGVKRSLRWVIVKQYGADITIRVRLDQKRICSISYDIGTWSILLCFVVHHCLPVLLYRSPVTSLSFTQVATNNPRYHQWNVSINKSDITQTTTRKTRVLISFGKLKLAWCSLFVCQGPSINHQHSSTLTYHWSGDFGLNYHSESNEAKLIPVKYFGINEP